MAHENVDVVRRMYEAFERDDWSKVTEFVNPDVELHGTSGGLSEGNVAHGLDAVRQTFEVWDSDAWEETKLTPQEYIDRGDQVLVLQHELRRGRGSGVEVESDTAVLFGLHEGRVIRMQGFMDQAEALRAAGLSE